MTPSQVFLRGVAVELWLSGIVALMTLLLAKLVAPRRVALRQLLWALVLIRLVLPPGLTHPLSLGRLLPGSGWPQAWIERSMSQTSATTHNAFGDEAPAGEAPAREDMLERTVLAAWALAALGLLCRDLLRTRRCWSLLRTASASDQRVGAQATQMASQLGIRRRVRVRITDVAVTPFTVGLLRPIVVLPRRLLSCGSDSVSSAVLAHELAHVARWDALWIWLQRIVQRLYFFDPVVWLASYHLHRGRELLCDERVVQSGVVGPRRYAQGLLTALELDLGRPPGLVPALGQGALMTRISRILLVRPSGRGSRLAAWIAAVAVAVFVLPMGGQAAAPAGQPTEAATGESGGVTAAHLMDPLPGARISAPYGRLQDHPFKHKPFDHTGVDLVATLGTAVHAAGAGRVEVATTDYAPSKNAGTVVVIDHGGGLKTYYAHLGDLLVAEGDAVSQGQPIARVGNTGLSTAPHLHFEVWLNGKPTAPGDFIPDLASKRQP